MGLSIQTSVQAQQPSSNHLEPIPAYGSDYDQAVLTTLIGNRWPELWMICKPSFTPESALLLRSELVNPKAKDPYSPAEPHKWILESATATKSLYQSKTIWRSRTNPDGTDSFDVLKDVPINRKFLEINEPFAKALQQVWESMLRQTRYPEEDTGLVGLDGTTYQFYCRHPYFGETRSPEDGLPADLVKLSERLLKLVQSPPEAQPTLLDECLTAAQRLEADAKKQVEKTKPK